MYCLICKYAAMQPGETTVTFECGELTLVIKHVPAKVCANCGEAYVDEAVAAELLQTAERMARSGAQVDVRRYVPVMAGAA